MKVEVNARGLKPEEIQEAIDSSIRYKNKSIHDLLKEQGEALLKLTEMVPDVAKQMLEVIKQHHPDIFKAATQEVNGQ